MSLDIKVFILSKEVPTENLGNFLESCRLLLMRIGSSGTKYWLYPRSNCPNVIRSNRSPTLGLRLGSDPAPHLPLSSPCPQPASVGWAGCSLGSWRRPGGPWFSPAASPSACTNRCSRGQAGWCRAPGARGLGPQTVCCEVSPARPGK